MFVLYIFFFIFLLIDVSAYKYLVDSVKANQSTLRYVHAVRFLYFKI